MQQLSGLGMLTEQSSLDGSIKRNNFADLANFCNSCHYWLSNLVYCFKKKARKYKLRETKEWSIALGIPVEERHGKHYEDGAVTLDDFDYSKTDEVKPDAESGASQKE